jgi:hypothetical protein
VRTLCAALGPTIVVRVRTLCAALGPTIVVTIGARSWRVPRVYIAFHGLTGRGVAAAAARFGWEELSPPAAPAAPRA